MCGRFTITMSAGEIQTLLEDEFNVALESLDETPRYNIAPTMQTIALLHDGKKYRAGSISWGFRFNHRPKPILAFNTRIETIQEKPFFKTLYNAQRIALLSNGYFEWDTQDKTPYWMHYPAQAPMFLGGIWRKASTFESSIITLKAPEPLAHIHPRVPFSMPLKNVAAWLAAPFGSPEMLFEAPTQIEPISKRVNTVSNNDASILKQTP